MQPTFKESNNKTFIQVEITDRNKKQVIEILRDYGFKLIHTISQDEKSTDYGVDYYFVNYSL